MRFRVLGPVEIDRDGSVVTLARRQERCLLGILLLEQGRLVPVERLADLLWDGQPPAHARRSLQSHAARIRAVLGDGVLVSRSGGYVLQVDPSLVDAHQFRALVHEASAAPELARRADLLRAALELWRGPVLQDAAGDQLRSQLCAELEELHLHAIEESIDAGLELGRPLIAELAGLTAAHPTRERLVELQMRALYEAGRPADALDVFARARERLADQLGADPGPGLIRLHQSILRGDLPTAPASAPSARHVPRCLPRDIGDFTGREEVLASLLAAIPSEPDLPSAILAVDGMPGVGKTALAVRLAHRVVQRYPDGQLAIDLHGHSEQAPLEPAAALDRLLRQLGVPGDRIPDGLDARVELWRTELAGRRVLLLLDNAATSGQIGPLLPTGPGCLTLVTSRRRLAGLDGARALALEVLTPDEAIALMHRIVGSRVLAEPDAAAEVARRCQYLTLAVRLAAARLSHRPSWTMRDLLSRLDPGLDEIAVDGRSVVSAFRLSYDNVSPGAQRLFRLLGLHPGPDIDVRAAASLADLALDAADAVLNELVDAHLLDEPSAGRYAFHDLLKEYATRLATDERDIDRETAIDRLLDCYLHTAVAATRLLEPVPYQFDYQLAAPPATARADFTWTTALEWYQAERANLTAMVHLSVDDRLERAWRLARAVWRFLYRSGYHHDNLRMLRRVLESAERRGIPVAAGVAHNFIAATFYRWGRWSEALEHLDQAVSIRRALGDHFGLAVSLDNRAKTLYRCGRYREAVESYDEVFAALMAAHAPEPMVYHRYLNVGQAEMLAGRLSVARKWFDRSLLAAKNQGDDHHASLAHAHLAYVELCEGRFATALTRLDHIDTLDEVSDGEVYAEAVCALGSAHRGLGDLARALVSHRDALTMMQQSGTVFGECDVRIDLAITLHEAGEDDEAIQQLTAALDIANRLDLAPQRAKALDILSAINKDDALRAEADTLYQVLKIPRPAAAATLDN